MDVLAARDSRPRRRNTSRNRPTDWRRRRSSPATRISISQSPLNSSLAPRREFQLRKPPVVREPRARLASETNRCAGRRGGCCRIEKQDEWACRRATPLSLGAGRRFPILFREADEVAWHRPKAGTAGPATRSFGEPASDAAAADQMPQTPFASSVREGRADRRRDTSREAAPTSARNRFSCGVSNKRSAEAATPLSAAHERGQPASAVRRRFRPTERPGSVDSSSNRPSSSRAAAAIRPAPETGANSSPACQSSSSVDQAAGPAAGKAGAGSSAAVPRA